MIRSDDMEECIQKFYVTDLFQLSLKENFVSKTLYVTECLAIKKEQANKMSIAEWECQMDVW